MTGLALLLAGCSPAYRNVGPAPRADPVPGASPLSAAFATDATGWVLTQCHVA